MKMVKIGLILITTSLLFSCNKKDIERACTKDMPGISGSYKLTGFQYKMTPASAPVDYLASMDACEKDDIIVLKQDGTYIYNDAGNQCSPNGSDYGTWSMSGNTINSDGIVYGIIQSYDCTTLVCYYENINISGDRYTLTLTKQ